MKKVLLLATLLVGVSCAGNSKNKIEEKNSIDPLGKTVWRDVFGKEVWMHPMKSHEWSRDSMGLSLK